MRKELRKNKDGSQYYSFLYFDKEQGKRVRISRETIRKRFGKDVTIKEDADTVAKLLDAEYETLATKLEKRAMWEKEYYDFYNLLNRYAKKQEKRAPNSYKNNVHYLRYYVLHYFLVEAKCNNIDYWPELYEDFQDWLETNAYLIKQPEKLISYGAKNHCIKALNTFMRQLYREKIIDKLILCEKFPSHQLNERSIDDVIAKEEMETIYNRLKKNENHLEATYLRLLYFTGMRSNEGLGVSLQDLYEGSPQHDYLKRMIERHNIKHFGYVVLMSQPGHQTRALRNPDGTIPRKPLKGRKKISEKNARIIPITDELLWQELTQLYNQQVDLFESKGWGDNPSNYALFDGLDKSTSTRRLQKAYKDCNLRYRSWHCCRHSCATNIIGETGDNNLARLWLGHSSPAVIERYVHIHQAIVRSSQKIESGQRIGIKKLGT